VSSHLKAGLLAVKPNRSDARTRPSPVKCGPRAYYVEARVDLTETSLGALSASEVQTSLIGPHWTSLPLSGVRPAFSVALAHARARDWSTSSIVCSPLSRRLSLLNIAKQELIL
jgi:hypothetical protein